MSFVILSAAKNLIFYVAKRFFVALLLRMTSKFSKNVSDTVIVSDTFFIACAHINNTVGL